jgi:hypothetical protein
MTAPLITAPGCYDGISAEDYHGWEICPGPSISSSGLKKIRDASPLHYWWRSPLNPARPVEKAARHFSIGKAAHDMLLLAERWPERYHILPDGFSRAKTKAMADDIAEADAALEDGKTLLTADDAALAEQMADAIRANRFAAASLTNGLPEQTLAWQDSETGVWLRARPDFLPHARRFIPDLKTAADASPAAFQRAMATYGYHQSAALYMDGIEAVFGERPEAFFFVVVEKQEPFCVALYQIEAEDIERGRMLNRAAINTFARCLRENHWPGYADDVRPLPLPAWEQRQIDQANAAGELETA